MAETNAISAIAPWVGSDDGMQPVIQRQLGEHRWYVELFAGGCRTLLNKAPAQIEWVNDLHPALINVLRTLAGPEGSKLQARLRRTVFCEQVFADAIEQYRSLMSAEDVPPYHSGNVHEDFAWATFVVWWMGKGGTAGGPAEGNISIRYDSKGGHGASRFRAAADSVRWLRKRLARVHIYNRDAIELAEKIEDRAGTLIYADPTFIGKESNYSFGLASRPDDDPSAIFRSDERDDHDRLAAALNRFAVGGTRVVLRYYDHPRLRELYPAERWRVIDCSRIKQLGTVKDGERRAVAPDVVLVNGEVFGE